VISDKQRGSPDGKPRAPETGAQSNDFATLSSLLSGATSTAAAAAFMPVAVPVHALAKIQADFTREWTALTQAARMGELGSPADRRFRSEAWLHNPSQLVLAHAYLLSARVMTQMVEAAEVGAAARDRLRFSIMQWVEAMSPSNFLALNPEAQQHILGSSGGALTAGLGNLLTDLRKGRITQTDETQFEIGRNVAITPGDVVYENKLFQLIQYTPLTGKVFARPLVIVPPNINKFYVLDLQPSNSLVRYAVEQGHTVFMVSWRNPKSGDEDGVDHATWGDYLDHAVLKALDVAKRISRQPQVNALGFCVGGTMLASALALARARGEDPVSSLTLLTAMLDFQDTGVLKVFVDEIHAGVRDRLIGDGGLMWGRELATTFSFLRPNDLVWNYVVGNYLKGETPPPFDVLFWNADSTNLPGPFFAWYFRNTYLENNLREPGKVMIDGTPIDFTQLDMPAYIFGSREDHIVPWASAYASTQMLQGPKRFVLGASGHIAGVVNPPVKQRRSYWAVDDVKVAGNPLPGDPDVWLNGATEHAGSWWTDWSRWLATQGGKKVAAPRENGGAGFAPIEPAPGRYVKTRA
jgi:polyhydroxyalkanoate synthase